MRTLTILSLALLAGACAVSVDGVDSWGIQLQGLDRYGAADRLEGADLDLVVIDRPNSCRGHELYPTFATVSRIRKSGKLCFAYINVGQAEDYRTYWGKTWYTPKMDGTPGNPEFLLSPDPDGWSGNFSVAYWDEGWVAVLDTLVAGAVRDGFDGVMLDWVAAWSDPKTAALARKAGVDPAVEMAKLVERMAERGRGRRTDFMVLLNDGAELLEEVPNLAQVVDGVVQESVSFYGTPSESWEDPKNADIPVPSAGAWSTKEQVRRLAALRDRGVKVFTLDYATRPENREAAEKLARENGFVPCVTRTPLDRLP